MGVSAVAYLRKEVASLELGYVGVARHTSLVLYRHSCSGANRKEEACYARGQDLGQSSGLDGASLCLSEGQRGSECTGLRSFGFLIQKGARSSFSSSSPSPPLPLSLSPSHSSTLSLSPRTETLLAAPCRGTEEAEGAAEGSPVSRRDMRCVVEPQKGLRSCVAAMAPEGYAQED